MPIPSVNRPPEAAPPTVAKPKRYTIPTVKKAPIQAKPQEEKNLVVVHGIKGANLHQAGETGLAMPSLGIIHKDFPFTGFGDVTLLAHPSHINPKHTPVYNKDAWTPRVRATVVKKGRLNNDRWMEFKNEVHDTADRSFDDTAKYDPSTIISPEDRVAQHRVIEQALENSLKPNLSSYESPDDIGYHVFQQLLPRHVTLAMEGPKADTWGGSEKYKFWAPKIQKLFDTKKYIKDRDGKWQVELAPENEKEILRNIRGKSTIKGGEYGGMNQIIHNDPATAIDAATARRLGSYADIKREAQKTLRPNKSKIESTQFPYHDASYGEGAKNRYEINALRKIVLRALKAGKTVEHYLSDRPLLDDKDIPVDDSEKARVAGILDDFVTKKRADTQGYFEAKPQRFFRLGDFKAAVVPKHHMEDYQDLFAQHGVKMYPYDALGTDAERGPARAAAVRRAAEENDLLLSEKDCGLEELKKSELLEELGVELELEELKKSCEDLEKGAMQRLYPFDPNKEMARPSGERWSRMWNKPEPVTVKDDVEAWSGQDSAARERLVSSISPEAKQRSLHKLHGLTSVRRNPVTKEREFLLHRGFGNGEKANNLAVGHYRSRESSSWTPDASVAKRFSQGNPVTSAWVPESSVAGYLPNLRPHNEEYDPFHHQIKDEQEVIVGPGKFELHQPGLAKSEEAPEEPSKCVLTIITDGIGHMLFIKRNDNHKWSVCAGHIEGDEDPEDAARREILEETGLTPEHITRIYESKNPNVTCYSAQCQGTPHGRNDPDNEGEPSWIDITRGIPANIYDNLAGPEDESNVVRQLFSKSFDLKKSAYNWLDAAGFLDLSK